MLALYAHLVTVGDKRVDLLLGVGPVSYTHLDVYKRQELPIPGLSVKYLRAQIDVTARIEQAVAGITAVSYTHLA